MANTRLSKHALNYKPRGRRNCGHPRKRWQRVDAGTVPTTSSMEKDNNDVILREQYLEILNVFVICYE
jgi:hypothetical protein